ncbi:calcium-binding protein [Desulfovibrio oxamicus]|uniref:Calcium-binding protein n=1 Tax=Nitratidesulfovibrio oxamicus TaxID=32016 RepID=A0ABS0J272_9BACT|nr:calcium-binding protein [Nitratidesulfovibrio oxamicus]MBG3876532.1 calcium-binding protein [Nitratidesulfovibrio oxamicus]
MILSPISGYLLRESQERQQEARRARYGTGPVSLRGSLTDAYDTVSTRTPDVVFEFGDVSRARQNQDDAYDYLLAGGDVLQGGKPITHVTKSGLLVEVGPTIVRGQDGSTAMGWAVSFSRNGELVGGDLIRRDTRVVENADGTVSLEAAPDGETLDGTEEGDFFIRLSDRQVRAGGGDDVVISLGGSGGVDGGTGNDAILGMFRGVAAEGPEGLARLDGGEGDDLIRADNGVHVALVGGTGNDTLDGAVAHALVRGGEGDDTLKGEAHYAVMDGEDGNDRYEMDLAAWSQVAGGNGDDALTGTFLRSDMTGGEGDDTFDGRFQVADLLGESGDDTFRGMYERGRADGGEGDDTFAAEAAHTTEFAGGVGDDTLRSLTSFFASYDGGEGDDVVELGRRRRLSPSGDYVPGGLSHVGWKVEGLAGDYYAEGDLAHNTVRGGEGADDLTVYGAPDDRRGLDDPARVSGGKGRDVVAIYGAMQRLGQLYGEEEDGEMGVLLLPYV